MDTKFETESLKRRALERPRHRWEAVIKIDLEEIGCEFVDWVHAAQGRAHRGLLWTR
jgi:hypothetical protein